MEASYYIIIVINYHGSSTFLWSSICASWKIGHVHVSIIMHDLDHPCKYVPAESCVMLMQGILNFKGQCCYHKETRKGNLLITPLYELLCHTWWEVIKPPGFSFLDLVRNIFLCLFCHFLASSNSARAHINMQ